LPIGDACHALRQRSSKCWAGAAVVASGNGTAEAANAESQLIDSPTRSHTFACFARQAGGSLRPQKQRMLALGAARGHPSMLTEIDRFCGQIAAAIHGSELQLYATLALIIVLSALLFPPKDDPDQV
jgi:hypothetical protein